MGPTEFLRPSARSTAVGGNIERGGGAAGKIQFIHSTITESRGIFQKSLFHMKCSPVHVDSEYQKKFKIGP